MVRPSSARHHGVHRQDSAYVDIFYPLYVPNAFTPNNDGVNDVFKAEGVNIRGYQMHIYNRWGQLIFTSDDPEEPWLGNVQGGDHYAPDGLYMWKFASTIGMARDGLKATSRCSVDR